MLTCHEASYLMGRAYVSAVRRGETLHESSQWAISDRKVYGSSPFI